MTYMGPMGPIPPGTPQWHQADQANLAQGQYVLNTSGHGAIAYSPSTGRVLTAWNYPSRADAEHQVTAGMPADAAVYWGHHTYLALAQGPSGYAFGGASSALRAMQSALEACGDAQARVTTLIDTSGGELDPESAWVTGEQMARIGRAFRSSLTFNLKAFFVLLIMLAIAAIGAKLPALGIVLFALAVGYALWRRRGRRRT